MGIVSFDAGVAARVCQAAQQRLLESPYFYLRGLTCDFRAGTLTLHGHVPYDQLRQFAEAIVSRVEGVTDVVNRVVVVDPQGLNGARAMRNAG